MKLAVTLSAIAALLASGVTAQDPQRIQTGSRFPASSERYDKSDTRMFAKRVARCVADRNPTASGELLVNSDPTSVAYDRLSEDFDKFFDKLELDECMVRYVKASTMYVSMRISPSVLRNLLAEELYLEDNDEPLTIPEGAPEELENRFFASDVGNERAKKRSELSDCLVYRAAAESDAFLRTRPTTKKERKAAEALLPVVDDCAGKPMDLQIGNLRKLIADGLWARHFYGSATPSTTTEDTASGDAS